MFDFKKAIPFTELYIRELYSPMYYQWEQIQRKSAARIADGERNQPNPDFEADIFRFRGKKYPLFDMWGLATTYLLNNTTYKNKCLEHSMLTNSGTFFKTSAESTFRYLCDKYDFMESHTDVDLSSCRFMTLKNGVISSGGCGGKSDAESIKALLLVTNPILHPGIIAKRDVISALGYDKNFTCTEDMELWTRFILGGKKVQILSEYLMIYRLHDKQITETTLDKQKKEVVLIQKNYLSELLQPMNEEQENFYINGVYFTKNTDVNKLCKFYKWAKSVNKRVKKLDKEALNYAFFEILAEYKRKGISKPGLIKGMLIFGLPFLSKELPARKKRARADGLKCIEAAKSIGLEMSGGTLEFPIFSKQ
jgi:hypothetical protein